MLILARVTCEEESCSLEKPPGPQGREGVRRAHCQAGWEQEQPTGVTPWGQSPTGLGERPGSFLCLPLEAG